MNRVAWPASIVPRSRNLFNGTVKIVENNRYWVDDGQGLRRMRKAISCLLEPQIEDTVLVYSAAPEEEYILAVLSRESRSPAEVVFNYGVSLQVREGKFEVASPEISFKSLNMRIVAHRLIQKLIRFYRTVEELEESKIGRLRCLVKGTFFTRSKKTLLKSEESTKIDASKIMLG